MASVTQLLNSLEEVWNKQSISKKIGYAAIIKLATVAVSIPVLLTLREIYWFIYRRAYSLPPGPNGLPFIGIASKWHSSSKARINLSKKYGPIFYASYIGFPYIVLSSSKLVKEVLAQKQFLDRDIEYLYKKENVHQPSLFTVGESQAIPLINIDGARWTKRRKVTQQTLFKTLNNKTIANLLKQTFDRDIKQYFDDIILSDNGQWDRTREIFEFITLSTIFSAIFGQRLGRNSTLFKTVTNNINETMLNLVQDTTVISMPFFKYIYGKKLLKLREERNDILQRLVNDHETSKNKDGEKSYIDYMQDMVKNGELTQDEVLADVLILFIAGMDTTSNTLQFAVSILAKYEETQEKIRKELLNVMGKEYNISLVNKCPLFRAALHEIMRISSIAYMGVDRGSKKDYWITLDDGTKYRIPKGCAIIGNYDYIHIYGGKDENWTRVNGDEIILENFLSKNEDGTVRFVKNESLIPFGVGKRDCVGRQLAMKELYYTLGYLLLNYKLSLTNEEDRNKDISMMRDTPGQTAYLDPVISVTIKER